jgi:UDPglucose 6-dehydrogenase
MTSPVIGFAGLTHLGINSLAAAAARGFDTIGFHPDKDLVNLLSRGKLPIHEPGLSALFDEHQQRLNFSDNPEVLGECDLVYISVDVPTDDLGQSDLGVVEKTISIVTPVLKDDALLVILCQVPPGFTRKLKFPRERLFYQVETLIFGRAVERAMYPERFIVGCADPNEALPSSLETLLSAFECPILAMRYESAELTKISINMCLVSSVCVANTMAELCEKVGADWSEVVPALKLDKRIGQYAYLKPGLGIAGGNLERDLATVVRLADNYSGNAEVVKAWIADSAYRKEWALSRFNEIALIDGDLKTIGVLGLAYKENTASLKNSAAIALLQNLTVQTKGYEIKAYDPEVKPEKITVKGVAVTQTALEAYRNADVVMLMTPWPEFGDLAPNMLASEMKGSILIDPYCVLNPKECAVAGLRQITLGRSLD